MPLATTRLCVGSMDTASRDGDSNSRGDNGGEIGDPSVEGERDGVRRGDGRVNMGGKEILVCVFEGETERGGG